MNPLLAWLAKALMAVSAVFGVVTRGPIRAVSRVAGLPQAVFGFFYDRAYAASIEEARR